MCMAQSSMASFLDAHGDGDGQASEDQANELHLSLSLKLVLCFEVAFFEATNLEVLFTICVLRFKHDLGLICKNPGHVRT